MGCHTWCYRKLDPQPTYDEVKANVLFQLSDLIEQYDQMINGNLPAFYMNVYPEYTPEFGLKWKSITERQIQMIQKDLCKLAMYNRYDGGELTTNIGFTLYENTEYHDPFRKYGYPEDKLFSLEETLQYIETNNDNITIFDFTVDKLNEFWQKYPDGVIQFG